ncbi:unnamed protein product, partial [Prorocentrum cordatum]
LEPLVARPAAMSAPRSPAGRRGATACRRWRGRGGGLAPRPLLRGGPAARLCWAVPGALERWTARGPEREPVIECEVPVEHGASGEDLEFDVVEVPVGLAFECGRVRAALRERLGAAADEELVEQLAERFAKGSGLDGGESEDAEPLLKLPWVDLAALAQLTYWYDRRPAMSPQAAGAGDAPKDERATEARFGRWTKKLSSNKVVYGAVALRHRTRAHLGAEVFRRPAGIDVTRLRTLQRAASLCGHDQLLAVVEETMHRLNPQNVARIPWAEVQRHNSKDDLWLLIDGRVYDVTPFPDPPSVVMFFF